MNRRLRCQAEKQEGRQCENETKCPESQGTPLCVACTETYPGRGTHPWFNWKVRPRKYMTEKGK